jgi:hypothetical protein
MAVTATNPRPAGQATTRHAHDTRDHEEGRATRGDRLVRHSTTASVVLLAAIAAIVSYRHMHTLVLRHGEAAWTAALLPLSVDGMIAASSMALLADSRHRRRGGVLPWALLVVGSAASLAANVAVAEPTLVGRLIASWPPFALIGSYELLMRQIRQSAPQSLPPASAHTHQTPVTTGVAGPLHAPASAAAAGRAEATKAADGFPSRDAQPGTTSNRETTSEAATHRSGHAQALDDRITSGDRAGACHRRQAADLRLRAWQWAQANRDSSGRLPAGKVIAARFGRKERWGRLVKRAGLAGSFGHPRGPAEQSQAA